MPARIISQRKFAKLVAATSPLAQPPGAIMRASNLLFTTRGSLQIADGSAALAPSMGSSLAVVSIAPFSNLLPSQFAYYSALTRGAQALADVTGASVSVLSGSAFAIGYYAFGVVAYLGSTATHTGLGAAVVSARIINNTVAGGFSLSWSAVTGATGYAVYFLGFNHLGPVNTSALSYGTLLTTTSSLSYSTTSLSGGTPAALPWGNNTTAYQLYLGSVPAGGSLGFSAVAAGAFYGLPPLPSLQIPGSPDFSSSVAVPGFSPYGGVTGSVCPVPLILQFQRQAILILGNGEAPHIYDPAQGTGGAVTPLANTFTAAYPAWQASVTWTSGSQLSVTSGGVAYLFTATQGGVSGASAPSWSYTTNSETSDGSVIWTCNGPIPASIAPIGAAHACSYAGSLWLANTWPTTTSYASWQASYAYTQGQQISVIDGSGNAWLFQVQTAGTSGASAPSWTFTAGSTTTDSGVTWLCIEELPAALAAGIDGPSCLKMSDANNPNSWNPVNVAFISKDDGTQITGIQPFTIAALGISPTGSLCVFKEFTTYQVIGVFGSSSFEIQPAQTNLGCIAPRSIQFLPGFGVVRFSHLGFAVFDGLNDRLISEDIRPYLFGGVDSESDLTPVDPSYVYRSVSAQTANPPMYLCAMPLAAGPSGGAGSGSLTRLFCYDLVMKAWAVLDLPWEINSLATLYAGEGYPLVVAGRSDGTIQRLQSGDLTWDAGGSGQANVAWSFRTPDVFGEGSSERVFYEEVVIRGYGSAAMVSSIVASLWLDGQRIGAQAVDVVPQGGSNLFEARVKIFRNGYRAHLDVSGTNGGAAGTIDALDWSVVPKSSLARRIIA